MTHMKAGFSLVELLIVIGLISLLSVSISPFLRGNQEQALLSRQADMVRQSFYETVMKAKTGASEPGVTVTGGTNGLTLPPVRGIYMSTSAQVIRPLALKSMTFHEAETKSLQEILADSSTTQNLLFQDAGKTSAKPLAVIEDLQFDTTGGNDMILLLEPVSNSSRLITTQGLSARNPDRITITLVHPTAKMMKRTMAISPGTSTIYEQ